MFCEARVKNAEASAVDEEIEEEEEDMRFDEVTADGAAATGEPNMGKEDKIAAALAPLIAVAGGDAEELRLIGRGAKGASDDAGKVGGTEEVMLPAVMGDKGCWDEAEIDDNAL